MATAEDRLARLRAFASEGGVVWPAEPGVTLHEWGPCFAGTRIGLDVLAEYDDDGGVLAEYPQLGSDQVMDGRRYWERHAPLFEAACWLSYTDNAAFPSPEGDQLETLQGDIRALLAALDAATARLVLLEDDAEEWRELREHVRTAGVVCWWEDGNVYYQEAPKTVGEFRERMRRDAARTGAGEG